MVKKTWLQCSAQQSCGIRRSFASSSGVETHRDGGRRPNNAKLTYWYWAESDAPGANGWLKKQVAAYEKRIRR